jgi:hypothetical protein
MDNPAQNDTQLGRVRLLKDVETVRPSNYMKAGDVVEIIRSPVPRYAHYTWVQGPMFAVRLLDGEFEKI